MSMNPYEYMVKDMVVYSALDLQLPQRRPLLVVGRSSSRWVSVAIKRGKPAVSGNARIEDIRAALSMASTADGHGERSLRQIASPLHSWLLHVTTFPARFCVLHIRSYHTKPIRGGKIAKNSQ